MSSVTAKPLQVIEHLYYLDPKTKFNPVAVRPQIFKDRVIWHSQSREKWVKGVVQLTPPPNSENKDYAPTEIRVTTDQGEVIVFQKLNLTLFNSTVKKQLMVPDTCNFTTDEELEDYYLSNP